MISGRTRCKIRGTFGRHDPEENPLFQITPKIMIYAFSDFLDGIEHVMTIGHAKTGLSKFKYC